MSESIAFRVPPEKKEEWQEAVKSSEEYNNLTHLIRLSVERELADTGGYTPSGEQAPASGQEMGKLLDQMETLSERIATIQHDVTQVLERSYAVGGTADKEITEDVFATLNTGDMGDRLRTDEIVERVDHDRAEVEMALAKLNEEMTSVERETLPDGSYWFRRG